MIERERPNQQFGSSTTLTNVKNIWKKVNMTVHGGFTKKKCKAQVTLKNRSFLPDKVIAIRTLHMACFIIIMLVNCPFYFPSQAF